MRTRFLGLGCWYLLFLGCWVGGVLLIDALLVAALVYGWDVTGEADARTRMEPAAVLSFVVMENLTLLALGWFAWVLLRRYNPNLTSLIETTPTGTRLRLQSALRAGRYWLVVLITAGIAFMASGIGVLVQMLPGYGWWAIGYVGLFGVVFAYSTWKHPPEGSYVLDDQVAGTLSWRVWELKGHQRRAICRAAITGVSVREHEGPQSGQGAHQVVIHWRLPGGPPQSDVMCECGRLDNAQALASWLRERLGVGKGEVRERGIVEGLPATSPPADL